jgi:gliding motility-associated-like protein
MEVYFKLIHWLTCARNRNRNVLTFNKEYFLRAICEPAQHCQNWKLQRKTSASAKHPAAVFLADARKFFLISVRIPTYRVQNSKSKVVHRLLTVLFIMAFLFSRLPDIQAQGNQTVTNGSMTAPVTFPGTSCPYTWTNSNPSIGLAASGSGNIPAFTAINTGTTPVTASITATPVPVPSGFVYVTEFNTNSVAVISLATNSVVTTIPVGTSPNFLAITPDLSKVYVTNFVSGTVSVISTVTNTVIATIGGLPSADNLAISPDGSTVYVSNYQAASIGVIKVATNTLVTTFTVQPFPSGLAVSPDGSLLYAGSVASNDVQVINTATYATVTTIPVGIQPLGVLLAPDGSKLYVANTDLSVSVINTTTNTVTATIPTAQENQLLTISPDGSQLYVSGIVLPNISVINTATNAVTDVITIGSGIEGIAVNPNGNSLYVSNTFGNNMFVVNTATNTEASSITGLNQPGAIAFDVTPTVGVGCSSTPITFTITVDPSPQITLSGAVTGVITACVSDSSTVPAIQQLQVAGGYLTGDISVTAPAGFAVSLDPGSGYSSNITLTQTAGTVDNTVIYVCSLPAGSPGTITGDVVLSTPGAANLTAGVTATILPLPVVFFHPDTVLITGNAGVQLDPIITGQIIQYQWTPATGLSATNIADPLAAPVDAIYRLWVTDTDGCEAYMDVTVLVALPLEMPNAFTPNGDGHNDIYRIPPGVQMSLEEFDIFDRWGVRVFSTRDISTGWDGTYHGVAEASATYVYMIRGKSSAGAPINLKGTVILVR